MVFYYLYLLFDFSIGETKIRKDGDVPEHHSSLCSAAKPRFSRNTLHLRSKGKAVAVRLKFTSLSICHLHNKLFQQLSTAIVSDSNDGRYLSCIYCPVQGVLLGYIYHHVFSRAVCSSSRPPPPACSCHHPPCPLPNVVVVSPCC